MAVVQICTVDNVADHLSATSTGTTPNRTFKIFGVNITEKAISQAVDDSSLYIQELVALDTRTSKSDATKYFAIDLSSLFTLGRVINGLGIKAHFNYQLAQMRVDKPLPSQMMTTLQRIQNSVDWWRRVLLKISNTASLGDVTIPEGSKLVPQSGGVSQILADSPWQGT